MLLQKKDSEGFGFVLRGAKGDLWEINVALNDVVTSGPVRLLLLQLRPRSKSSPPPRRSPPCSTWSRWTRAVLRGEPASGWEISS